MSALEHVRRHPALENAEDAIAYEDWLRRWPCADQTAEIDKRARKVGMRVARAPEYKREEVFSTLWWIRFIHEPVIADLVRVGVGLEEAEERMGRRLAQFRRAFDGRT